MCENQRCELWTEAMRKNQGSRGVGRQRAGLIQVEMRAISLVFVLLGASIPLPSGAFLPWAGGCGKLPRSNAMHSRLCRTHDASMVPQTRGRALPVMSLAVEGESALMVQQDGARSKGGKVQDINVPGALRNDGLVMVPVGASAVAEAREVYEELRSSVSGFRRCVPALAPRSRLGARSNIIWTEEVPYRTEASGFRVEGRGDGLSYDIYTTGWTPTMRWVTAGTGGTLDRLIGNLGSEIKAALEKEYDEEFVINSACFVVVTGSVQPNCAKLHADWATKEIPRDLVFTALTPLWEFPPSVGGLLWRPHSDPKREGGGLLPLLKHKYCLGEAVVFDGKLMHQTEPFESEGLREGFERVLASFSFCAKSEGAREHWPHIEQVLRDQTAHFYVTPSGPAGSQRTGFLSYEIARKEVASLGFTSYAQWWKWSRSPVGRPRHIPIRPDREYAGAGGWKGWAHWLGYERTKG